MLPARHGESKREPAFCIPLGFEIVCITSSWVWKTHPGEAIPRKSFCALDWPDKDEIWNVPTFGGKGYSNERGIFRREDTIGKATHTE